VYGLKITGGSRLPAKMPNLSPTSTMDPYIPSPALDLAPGRAVAPLLAPAASPSRLAVAREMLETLETLTNAGQRHLMAKVVTFIGGHLATGAPGARERHAALQLLNDLKRESERPSPAVATFRRHAESLIVLLTPLR
jgi:hypothetical protein